MTILAQAYNLRETHSYSVCGIEKPRKNYPGLKNKEEYKKGLLI